jgi:hypothetical protein
MAHLVEIAELGPGESVVRDIANHGGTDPLRQRYVTITVTKPCGRLRLRSGGT